MSQQSGALFLLPTPLGDNNPSEVLPAYNFKVINELRFFVVEDLRSARRFLRKVNPTFPIDDSHFFLLNEHTVEHFDNSDVIQILLSGTNVGLLSEAGVPCVADPGATIVKAAQSNKIQVKPLVGASSILLALMASGLCGQNFAFHGYLPTDRMRLADAIKKMEAFSFKNAQTQIFIETPYRNVLLFETILNVCQSETYLCVASELTLPNQFIFTRTIARWKQQSSPLLHKKPTVFLLQG